MKRTGHRKTKSKNKTKNKTNSRVKRQSIRKLITKNKLKSNRRYTRKRMKHRISRKKKIGGYKLCEKASEIEPYAKKSVEWLKKFDEQLRKDVLCKMNSASLNTYLEPSKNYENYENNLKRGIGLSVYGSGNDDLYSGCYGVNDHKPSIFSPVDWVNGFNKEKKYGLNK